MPTFWVCDWIKAKFIVIHSKGDKICDMDTTSRQAKLLIFKQKTLSFYTTDFSNINISP